MEIPRPKDLRGRRTLPRLYGVTDTHLAGMTHPEIVRQLLQGGCRWIQIRDKDQADCDLLPQVAESVALCRQAGALLIVNDRPELAARTQADGVHLGQEDTPPHEARRLLGPSVLIGRSAHNLELAVVADQDSDVDYVAIGPLFVTSTKVIETPPLGIAEAVKIRSCIRKPLVAIGGINLENAADLIAAGMDSLAIVSALMSPAPIHQRAEAFLSLFRPFKWPPARLD
jgi:thiamine-phosphate pyrophosphorylase